MNVKAILPPGAQEILLVGRGSHRRAWREILLAFLPEPAFLAGSSEVGLSGAESLVRVTLEGAMLGPELELIAQNPGLRNAS